MTQDKPRHWYALYTRPRFEKKVDKGLRDKSIESFLPVTTVIRYWSDRKKRIEEPLFPSYVFVHADEVERYRSLETSGVVRMVSFNGRPSIIPEPQIANISRILACGYSPLPHEYLHYGDVVEIVSGPLKGIKGYFLEERGQQRLAISVEAIKQTLVVEIERGLLRKCVVN